MFSRFRGFLRRHRGKFLAAAVIGGGVWLLKLYAERRLRQWAERETIRMLESSRKRAHYESTHGTCRQSVSGLTPRLLNALVAAIDTDDLLNDLKNGKCDKKITWLELQRRSVLRVVTSVYASVIFVVMIKIQIYAVSGSLYVDSYHRVMSSDHEAIALDGLAEHDQERYLALIEHLLTRGIRYLASVLMPIVDSALERISLKDQLNLEAVESLLWRIKTQLESDVSIPTLVTNCCLPSSVVDVGTKDRIGQLIAETCDLLGNPEMILVVNQVASRSFSHVLDQLAESFRTNQDGGGGDFQSPLSIKLPVPRLIPVFSKLPQVLLSNDEYGSLINVIQNDPMVQTLASNVYESFSYVNTEQS